MANEIIPEIATVPVTAVDATAGFTTDLIQIDDNYNIGLHTRITGGAGVGTVLIQQSPTPDALDWTDISTPNNVNGSDTLILEKAYFTQQYVRFIYAPGTMVGGTLNMIVTFKSNSNG